METVFAPFSNSINIVSIETIKNFKLLMVCLGNKRDEKELYCFTAVRFHVFLRV